MVGADETELHARLTHGGLLIDAGATKTGFAEMHEVKERSVAENIFFVSRTRVRQPPQRTRERSAAPATPCPS